MRTDTWSVAAQASHVYQPITELHLEAHVAELDAYGYTVIPPDSERLELARRLADHLQAISRQRSNGSRGGGDAFGSQTVHYLAAEGPDFEQALLHPVPLALITYLLGESCLLSSMVGMVKGPGDTALPLHSDTGPGVPEPFPRYAQVANATWLLSDYTVEGGALCFVPGSHHLCRHPASEQADPRQNPAAQPVIAPTGSLVVWHGNLWHGALPRTSDGVRLNLIMFFARPYFRLQEDYRSFISSEALKRNSARFRGLLGVDHPFPASREHGVDTRQVAAMSRAGKSVHA